MTSSPALSVLSSGLDDFRGEEGHALATVHCEPRWYAVYTRANHEKRVAEQLTTRHVEHFLATYSSVRRWKDRRVKLQLPLFPGYVFVCMELRNRVRVLQIPGIARLVGFGGVPTPLPKEELATLRAGLASGLRTEPHPYIRVGRRMRIKEGPLAGLEGILLRRKANPLIVLSVDLIQRSVAVEIEMSSLEPTTR